MACQGVWEPVHNKGNNSARGASAEMTSLAARPQPLTPRDYEMTDPEYQSKQSDRSLVPPPFNVTRRKRDREGLVRDAT